MDLKPSRAAWLSLLFCGGSCELAVEKYPYDGIKEGGNLLNIEDYREIKASPEFEAWRKEFVSTFTDYLDGFLLGRMFKLCEELDKMDPKIHQNYARVNAEFIKLLDRTAPMIERMRKLHDSSEGDLTGHKIDLTGDGVAQV